MSENFDRFYEIVKKLRVECPWDRKQTMDSLKSATLEETYEVIESIDDKNYDELKKELGDLLLHVLFYSSIAEDEKLFNINDVIDSITEKLIRRHPHVFGDTKVTGSEEVKVNWEKIKMQEGRESVIAGVPKHLPSLQRAERLQDKASKVGFDWSNADDVWKKVIEELNEFKEANKKKNQDEMESEFGDLLFSLVNYSRFMKINPENALRRTNEKFIKRFNYVEARLKENGKSAYDSNLEEMDKYWEESKRAL
jgi:XTP/dITP diphosphohydrolase